MDKASDWTQMEGAWHTQIITKGQQGEGRTVVLLFCFCFLAKWKQCPTWYTQNKGGPKKAAEGCGGTAG